MGFYLKIVHLQLYSENKRCGWNVAELQCYNGILKIKYNQNTFGKGA